MKRKTRILWRSFHSLGESISTMVRNHMTKCRRTPLPLYGQERNKTAVATGCKCPKPLPILTKAHQVTARAKHLHMQLHRRSCIANLPLGHQDYTHFAKPPSNLKAAGNRSQLWILSQMQPLIMNQCRGQSHFVFLRRHRPINTVSTKRPWVRRLDIRAKLSHPQCHRCRPSLVKLSRKSSQERMLC